jgi:signal transduction histidine kinase
MSLVNRVSLFFLAALAVVLAGFALTLYLLAARYLHAQADHRLESALQTLVAATEVHPNDVEWEPTERRITMGDEPGPEHLRWTVHDLDGRLVDCSPNLERPRHKGKSPTSSDWRVLTRRVRAGSFTAEQLGKRSRPHHGAMLEEFPDGQLPGTVALPANRAYHGAGLVLTVAVPEGPIAATLRQLALALILLSVATWLAAALGGRWLCRRALAPITRMAASARSVRLAEQNQPLDVAATRDELEDLGRAFNDLLADLRQSLERQCRFTGDASHQLRTPLTALLASVEVALRHERSPEEYQRVLQVVRRRGVQLRQIIESLLFLARAESDASLPDAEAIPLAEWCRSWLEGWSEHPRAADLVFHAEAGDVSVCVNPALLGQVIDNLLDNACKYSEPGQPVGVSVGAENGAAVLTVADAGCGIAADELPLVWEPFFRSTQARWRGTPGVGLGLTVARRLAALLGGRLEVRSEPGHGSRFRVVLPAQAGQAAEAGEGAVGPGVGAG